jgi:succinyl-diaminopimelate desuccinylase
MDTPHHALHDVQAAAKEDHESVLDLTQRLVAVPSRSGVDPTNPCSRS